MDPPANEARDHELLRAARDGDTESCRQLLQRHGASMMRMAWSVLGRYAGTEAEDVCQEALLAALTTRSLPKGDVGAWLRAITIRKGLDWQRWRQRKGERSLSAAPEQRVEERRDSRRVRVLAVRQALSQLSDMDRALLLLVDFEGRTMAEAARVLGTSRAAAKWRAVRARRKLAGSLRDLEANEDERRMETDETKG